MHHVTIGLIQGNLYKLLFAFVFVYIACPAAVSQIQSICLPVRQFSLEEGLNQSMVTCQYKDEDGLIWVGTGSGINYFDGRQLHYAKIVNTDRPNHAIIRQIKRWDSENLLVCTSQEIGLLNRNSFHFKSLYTTSASEPVPMWSSKNGLYIYWTLDIGFFVLQRLPFSHVLIPWGNLNKQFELEPKQMLLTPEGSILISHRNGIVSFDTKQKTSAIFYADKTPILMQNKKRNILMVNMGWIYTYDAGEFVKTCESQIINAGLGVFSNDSSFWLYDLESGILTKNINCNEYLVYPTQQKEKFVDSLSTIIKFIEFDDQGNMFIGTDGAGFMTHNKELFDFKRAMIGFSTALVTTRNHLWAGTTNNGLWKMNLDLINRNRLSNDYLKEHTRILSLQSDNMNRAWVLTQNHLVVFNERDEIEFVWQPEDGDVMSAGRLIRLSSNTILLNISRSTNFETYGESIYFKTEKKPRIERRLKEHDLIVYIKKVGNEYWLAGRKGLYINNSPDLTNAKMLHEGIFYCIAVQDKFVYASSKTGLHQFTKSGTCTKTIDIKDAQKLSKITPYGLIVDNHKRLWFSTNMGIGFLHKNEVFLFDKAFNLQSLEFFASSYYTNDEFIYFGGVSGVNCFKPNDFERVKTDKHIMKPLLLSLYVDQKSVCSGLPKAGDTIRLNQNSAHLSGEICGNQHAFAELNQYSFFLKNYDKNWSSARGSGFFEYDQLPPGAYELMSKFKNAYGSWSEPSTLAYITVPAFFYQHLWFKMMVLVLILLLTAFSVRMYQNRRHQQVITQLNRQRELDQERLRIARNVHDELGGGLSKMLVISQLMEKKQADSKSVHELRASIQNTCTDLLKNLSEVVWSLKNESLSILLFQAKLTEITAGLLENTDIRFNFNIIGSIPENYICSTVFVKNVLPAFKEAITNVIKHAKADQVSISLHFDDNKISITIEDNGCGIQNKSTLGNGISNMEHRIGLCSGQLIIERKIPKGTILIFKNLSLEKI